MDKIRNCHRGLQNASKEIMRSSEDIKKWSKWIRAHTTRMVEERMQLQMYMLRICSMIARVSKDLCA